MLPVLAGLVLATTAAAEPVAELHYRAILFDFFQDDYFTASTRALAYEQQQVLGERHRDAELLRAGMYLSYGLFDAAEAAFQALLDDSVAVPVRQRAWYHLGRLAYQRGDLGTAEAALKRIGDQADAARRGQRDLLLGLIAMRRGDYEAALGHLETGQTGERTRWYALYNLGIAALRAGEHQRGRSLLDAVGSLQLDDGELLALRDRANVALGFHALSRADTKTAGHMFDRVRLDGPFGNRALLGAGWAAARAGQHRQALVAWQALMDRDMAAAAVQEAHLAAPYGLLQLGAEHQAAQAYRDGIAAYGEALERLQRARAEVESGELIRRLRRAARYSRGKDWPPRVMRETPGGEYLPNLLAGHDFQRAAANFRELHALRRHLASWAQSMESFELMLETRRQRYRRQLAAIEQALAALDMAALQGRRDALAKRIERIAAEEDALALATTAERRRLEALDQVRQRLGGLPAGDREALARRARVLGGYQRWRIATDFAPRLWAARKALKALDTELAGLRAQRDALVQARAEARARFQGFAERIDRARQRVATLLPRVDAAIGDQRQHLEQLAAQALEARAQRLRGYLAQARFALAQLYDRAGARAGGEP